ncbi:MAG: hypothetical protein KFW21_00010 [Spirochaetota bacterium]|nr:hypothetical protein [Spirochaetota bacterium]
MSFMKLSIVALSIVFSSASYTQDVTQKINNSGVRSTKQVKNSEQKEVVFTSLSGKNPFSFNTFQAYSTKRKIANTGIMEWKNRYQLAQKKYNVSLIGVNVNTWLENPEYFNILEVQGKDFSITNILDNLQSYNPNLVFNDPEVVRTALNTDIYQPYLNKISNYTEKSIRFSDINKVISYTRRYHVYGVAAGGLPYFGRPVEGGQRNINLGVLSGQLDEAAVKLPDTDIFLVAMVNVIPNWLEEGMNIFHISQQELEILVYAFDRRGKLLGGAGIPMDFVHNGQYFMMEQKIRSKIWQKGVSRQFYLWSSFRMLNDKDETKAPIAPNITLPPDIWPKLNKQQKQILTSIKYLRANKKKINVELFTPTGELVFSPTKIKETNKVVLANRIILHKDSPLLVQSRQTNISELVAYKITGRFENMSIKNSKKVNIDEKNILTKKNTPSNEGQKLISLFQYGKEILIVSPISHTNELYYTNEVFAYELEADPVLYVSERNKYFSLPQSLKKNSKVNKINNKAILKKERIKIKDKIFWNQFLITRLKDQGLATQEMKNKLKNWKSLYNALAKIENKIYKIDQKIEIYADQEKLFDQLKKRNIQFLNQKYMHKTDTLSNQIRKLDVQANKLFDLLISNQKDLKTNEQRKLLEQEYNVLLKRENDAFTAMVALFPSTVNYMKTINKEKVDFIDITDIVLIDSENIKKIAQLNNISPELVAVAGNLKKYSPIQKFNDKQRTSLLRKQKNKEKLLYFEGFSLGITRDWKTRAILSGRMDFL